MPSSTFKQARTMAGAAHNPQFAAKVGIPQSVARDFNQADKGTQLLKQAMKARHLRSGMTAEERAEGKGDSPAEDRAEM